MGQNKSIGLHGNSYGPVNSCSWDWALREAAVSVILISDVCAEVSWGKDIPSQAHTLPHSRREAPMNEEQAGAVL